jgi:prepilin-type N-terminal cleavage/methylation domain-containing protein
MNPKRSFSRLNAFSLVELVVVLLIIAAIAAVAIPSIGNMVVQSRVRVTQKEMVELVRAVVGNPETGLRGYLDDLGTLPDASLSFLYTFNAAVHSPYNPFARTGWNGPYIDTTRKDINRDGVVGANEYDILYDAWGNPYTLDDTVTPPVIESAGPDGVAGNADDITIPLQ